MDTDSEPLNIDYSPQASSAPLQIALADPDDSGSIIQISATRWHYWPGFRQRLSATTSAPDSTEIHITELKISEIDICAGDHHTRIQVWPTQYLPQLSARYPNPYRSPLPHRYDTPVNFVHVNTQAEASRQLSPHLTMQQFLPVLPSSGSIQKWPLPVLIRAPLLEKLESVLTVLAEHGKPAETLTILSGYRTPRHNRRVGGATYSRHMYGDAVDFIVDTNNDGKMDDLNGDGKVSRADLKWLLDRLARRSVPVTAGGTGAYESHGQAEAFLHVDARGRAFYWQ